MRPARWIAAALVGLALAATSPSAAAKEGSEKEAQALFDDGLKLMNKKRYAEACESFAKSQELDPGMGTLYRLAECYEKLGRLASAYEHFMEVANTAAEANKADRALVAKNRALALEPRVAKLTIDLSPEVASIKGLDVRRDGKPVDRALWGSPIPVDPGDHVVTVHAPRKKTWEGKVWAQDSAKLLVSVAALEDAAPAGGKRGSRSKAPAIVMGTVGGVGVVLGATFLALRAVSISDAEGLHDKIRKKDGTCVGGGSGDFVSDCRSLSSATSAGDTFGTGSIVGFAVGGAALIGMVTYLAWPSGGSGRSSSGALVEGVRVAPVVGDGRGGLVVQGSF